MFSSRQISSGQEILALLNCRRLPARLSTGETPVSWVSRSMTLPR